MPRARLELALLTELDLKSSAATNYATRASIRQEMQKSQHFLLTLRPRQESNLRIRVLQTLDLPLVYVAVLKIYTKTGYFSTYSPKFL